MNLSELKSKYVFTTRIEIDDDFIELREPSQKELIGLKEDASANLEVLEKIFPLCVVDTSIMTDAGNKAKGNEIYDVIKESGSLMTEILTTWLNSIPFQSRLEKKEKSDK